MFRDFADRIVGVFRILFLTARRFGEAQAAEAAASLAYYAFFSLFPLLLLLISVGSFALESERVQQLVFQAVSTALPVSTGFIQNAIAQVLSQRGAVGVASLVGLIWSASGGFSVLVRHINKSWPDGSPRSSIRRRFFGIGIVLILLLLLGMWFVSNAILDVLPRFQVFELDSAAARRALSVVPSLFTFLMFVVLYRWVPNRDVSWSAALWSALAASLGWEVSSNLFNRYISSGLSNLDLVYGSLSAIVSFLIWVYIVSLVTLFCAHLGASIAAARKVQPGI